MSFVVRNQSSSHNTKTISYKRIKKKLAVMTMLLSLTTVSAETTVVETMQRCDAATQQNIFSSLPQCLPRKSLVDLRKYFSDDYDVIQVRLQIAITHSTIMHHDI